jgi:hypothetical protein
MGSAVLSVAGFRETLTLAGVLTLARIGRALAGALSLAGIRAAALDGRTGKSGGGKGASSENRGGCGNKSALIHPNSPENASMRAPRPH